MTLFCYDFENYCWFSFYLFENDSYLRNILFIIILKLIWLTDLDRLFHVMPLMRRPNAPTHLLLDRNLLLGVHTIRGYPGVSIKVQAVPILRRCIAAWSMWKHPDWGSVLRGVLRGPTPRAAWVMGLAVVVGRGAHISICGNFLALASGIVRVQWLIVINCWFWLLRAGGGRELGGGVSWGLVDTVVLFWDPRGRVWGVFWLSNVNWAIQASISTSKCFLFLYNSLLNLVIEHREHILGIFWS